MRYFLGAAVVFACVSACNEPPPAVASAGPPATASAANTPSVATAASSVAPVAESPTAAGSGAASTAASSTTSAPIRSTAIATFLRTWTSLLPSFDPDRAGWAKNIDRLVHSARPPLEVRTEACRARRDFIGKNIPYPAKLQLFGDLTALDRDGDCQVVFVAGGMMQETEFILDRPATSVLFAWIVPEG